MENLCATEMRKTQILMNKLVYLLVGKAAAQKKEREYYWINEGQ